MATLQIPTRADLTHYTQTVDLDGVTHGLELYWNERDASWYLTLWDEAFTTRILASRRIVLGAQLVGRFRLEGLPAGELVPVDTSGQSREAGQAELGERVVLLYLEAASIAAQTAAE